MSKLHQQREVIVYTTESEFTVIHKPDGGMILDIRPDHLEAFREVIRRATNTWPDAHAAVHELSDIVRVGHIQQEYKRPGVNSNIKK